MTQLELPAPGKARHDHPDTSKAAALAIAPKTGSQRARILHCIVEHGPMTDEEIQHLTGIGANSERPRRIELVEGGWVIDGQATVKTRAGVQAILWCPTAKALAYLEQRIETIKSGLL